MLKSLILIGAATFYIGSSSAPLYCDQFFPKETLTYGSVEEPWIALDVGMYEEGSVLPGDEILVSFNDSGKQEVFKALDAGLLSGNKVDLDMDGKRDTPIVIDIPERFKPDENMSWGVVVVNLSALKRMFE